MSKKVPNSFFKALNRMAHAQGNRLNYRYVSDMRKDRIEGLIQV